MKLIQQFLVFIFLIFIKKTIIELLNEYKTLATTDIKEISDTAGITDDKIKNELLEPILRIYSADIRSDQKQAFTKDKTKQPKNINEADKIFEEIRLSIKNNLNSTLLGLKAAANSVISS
jgi:hypothetical protein